MSRDESPRAFDGCRVDDGVQEVGIEAERVLWYKKLPVPEGWHQAYARGEIDVISEWSDKVAQVRMR